HWLQYDRPTYWQGQVKRRREEVAAAQAEVFRRKLAKTADYTPAYSEQKELLRRAEAHLHDAETRVALVKKWGPALQRAALKSHAGTRRTPARASGAVPRPRAALGRMVAALESSPREAPPSGASPPVLESIADTALGSAPDPVPDADTAA